MKSSNIIAAFIVAAFTLLILSCANETTKFKTDFTSALDSADMIEFTKGKSSHRFVFPEDLRTIKKILRPVDLSESQVGAAEFPIQITLYKNSEMVGEVSVSEETGLVYSLNNKTRQAGRNDQLNAFIKGIQF
jgi:hypothetical protein